MLPKTPAHAPRRAPMMKSFSLLSLPELPEEGVVAAPPVSSISSNSSMYLQDHAAAAAAVDTAVQHAIRFQKDMKASLNMVEEQLMETFARTIADLLRQDEALRGALQEMSASAREQTDDSAEAEAADEKPGSEGSAAARCPYKNLAVSARAGRARDQGVPPWPSGGVCPATTGQAAASREKEERERAPKLRSRAEERASHLERSSTLRGAVAQEGSSEAGSRGKRPSVSSNFSEVPLQEKVESVASWILDRQSRQSPCAERVWRFLEDPESSILAHWFHKLMPGFILATVFATLLQTVEWRPISGMPAAALEMGIDALFALEFVLRFAVYPNRWHFPLDVYNLIDFAAAVPLVIRVVGGFNAQPQHVDSWLGPFLLCFVPVLRLLKILRRFRQFHLLLKAFRLAFEALPVLLFCYFVGLLLFSALIYSFERPDNVRSLSQAMWLTVVTMTTLGYGDLVPQTTAGQVVVSILTIASTLYMAVPLGIIGNCFHQVWSDRDRILIMQILKQRLRQWGYTAADIPKLFEEFDMDGDGMLDFEEFRRMVEKLRLGLREERAVQLFETFDEDHGGSIDAKEFVRATFPTAFHHLYNNSKNEKARQTITASIVQLMRVGSNKFGSKEALSLTRDRGASEDSLRSASSK